jgi:hypothetical protein
MAARKKIRRRRVADRRRRAVPKTRRIDVTRHEFESLRGAFTDVLSIVKRNRRDIDRLFSEVADLRARLGDLHDKIRF